MTIDELILHAWDDTTCIDLLERVAAAATSGGRVIILECTIGGDQEGAIAEHRLRIPLLVGGRERAEGAFRRLFERSWLGLTRAVTVASADKAFESEVL